MILPFKSPIFAITYQVRIIMNQLTEQQLNDIKFVLQNFTHETLQKDLIALNTLKKAELGAGI